MRVLQKQSWPFSRCQTVLAWRYCRNI